MSTLSIYQTQNNLEIALAKKISEYFTSNQRKKILFLVSGGSAIAVLDFIEVNGSNIAVSLLDERSDGSNFLALSQTKFYKKISFFEMNKWPKADLVVALMGIGLDGHTAGIIPYSEDPKKFKDLFEGDEALVNYNAGHKNFHPLRTTVSISFLKNRVDQAFVYVKGEEKKEILKKVLESKNTAEYPAAVINFMKKVSIYSDLTHL